MAVSGGDFSGGSNVVHEVWVDGWSHFYPQKEVEGRLWQSTDLLLSLKGLCVCWGYHQASGLLAGFTGKVHTVTVTILTVCRVTRTQGNFLSMSQAPTSHLTHRAVLGVHAGLQKFIQESPWRAVCMAALHTLHRASQRLGVLTRDRAGGCTAVIAPFAFIAVFLNILSFTALGCGDKRKGGDHVTLNNARSQCPPPSRISPEVSTSPS